MDLLRGIVREIKNDDTLSAKLFIETNKYRLYPSVAGDDALPNETIIYSEVDQSFYPPNLRTSIIQFVCVADTVSKSVALGEDIDRIFNNCHDYQVGGLFPIIYSALQSKTALYDADADLHQTIVDIFYKY